MHELDNCRGRRVAYILPGSSECFRSATLDSKFVTAGRDRGLDQLPKRSRNFSNVRTLNLV
jgi:hypothetical protein